MRNPRFVRQCIDGQSGDYALKKNEKGMILMKKQLICGEYIGIPDKLNY